jgi:hypothetical protein
MINSYFENKIASVGEIANAFYNNALILLTLKSDTTSDEMKEAIAKAFNRYYKCNGTKQYTSMIDRTQISYKDQATLLYAYYQRQQRSKR